MFDHVTIRVADSVASRRFYETVLAPLGRTTESGELFDEWGDFSIAPALEEHPLTRGLHVAFVADSQAQVETFWRAGVDAGYASDGEPGLRPGLDRSTTSATTAASCATRTATAPRLSTTGAPARVRRTSTTCGCGSPS